MDLFTYWLKASDQLIAVFKTNIKIPSDHEEMYSNN